MAGKSDLPKKVIHMSKNNKKISSSDASPLQLVNGEGVKLPTFRTQFNAHLFPDDNEVNFLPSLVLPNQALTVREILDRQRRGIPFPVGKVPLYEGEDTLLPPEWRSWDLSEKEAYKEQLAQKALAIRTRWDKQEQEKQDEKRKESYRKEFEREHQEKQKQAEALKNFPEKPQA